MTEKFPPVAPDLNVEVSSPSTRDVHLGPKRDLYERVGVREYRFVDLDRDEVVVCRHTAAGFATPDAHGRGASVTTWLLPGLVLDVDEVLGPTAAMPWRYRALR